MKKDDSKEDVAKAIIDFLQTPTGKTFEEVQKDEPEQEQDDDASVGGKSAVGVSRLSRVEAS